MIRSDPFSDFLNSLQYYSLLVSFVGGIFLLIGGAIIFFYEQYQNRHKNTVASR
jgi:hypothetical protein